MSFLRERGLLAIQDVSARQEATTVYNLTVRDLHMFAVGQSQVLVHNTSYEEAEAELLKAIEEVQGLKRGNPPSLREAAEADGLLEGNIKPLQQEIADLYIKFLKNLVPCETKRWKIQTTSTV